MAGLGVYLTQRNVESQPHAAKVESKISENKPNNIHIDNAIAEDANHAPIKPATESTPNSQTIRTPSQKETINNTHSDNVHFETENQSIPQEKISNLYNTANETLQPNHSDELGFNNNINPSVSEKINDIATLAQQTKDQNNVNLPLSEPETTTEKENTESMMQGSTSSLSFLPRTDLATFELDKKELYVMRNYSSTNNFTKPVSKKKSSFTLYVLAHYAPALDAPGGEFAIQYSRGYDNFGISGALGYGFYSSLYDTIQTANELKVDLEDAGLGSGPTENLEINSTPKSQGYIHGKVSIYYLPISRLTFQYGLGIEKHFVSINAEVFDVSTNFGVKAVDFSTNSLIPFQEFSASFNLFKKWEIYGGYRYAFTPLLTIENEKLFNHNWKVGLGYTF